VSGPFQHFKAEIDGDDVFASGELADFHTGADANVKDTALHLGKMQGLPGSPAAQVSGSEKIEDFG
jgi:hypothetical protein